ncbi:MAG: RNA polymerase sigma factor [Terriglobia bacterium]
MEQDLELVKRCLTGEDAAWEALLRAHTSKVYNLCYRFTGNTSQAEDLTQEVFIKIYQTLKSFDAAQGAFTTWLNRIARNHLVDHYRRTKKERITDSIEDKAERVEEKAAAGLDPLGEVESREVRELLQAALAMLSPEMREAVILRDLQELDYQEIAQVLGTPEGTVKSRINRGRLELARIIKRMKGMKG